MWNFWKGYVILQIEGLSIARFLKRMSDSGIRVFRLRETEPAVVRFEIEARRFFDLHRLRRGLPVRIRIIGKRGAPFVCRRIAKRPVLWIGTLLVTIGLCVASQRVWLIRIEGAQTVSRDAIYALLKEHGIHTGVKPKGPVLITAANDLSVRVPGAAWIGLDREGIMLKVSVVESLPESIKKNESIPSCIVADRDGVITSIDVMRGQACVKAGDSVKAGDLLISGIVMRNGTAYATWADGTVKAAIRYEATCEVPEKITESVQTDRRQIIRILRIGSFELFRTKPDFERYRLTDVQTIAVSDRLPVYCDLVTACEIVLRERIPNRTEAEQIALCDAREAALNDVPKDASILNQYGTIQSVDGKRYALVIVTAEETIGRTEEYPNDG